MDRMVVDEIADTIQHDAVPLAPPVVPAADKLNAGVRQLHDVGELPRHTDVVLGASGADLPGAVHLVAEAPVLHTVGLRMPVPAPEVGPVRVPRAVAVFDPRLGLVHRAGPHVDHDERLRTELAAVRDELVGAEAVGLLAVPGKLHAPGAVRRRPDAVRPAIAAHEIAARPAQHRHAQRSQRVQHVAPEALRVAERRAFLEDSAVNAAAEVFDETAEDRPIHAADPPRRVYGDPVHTPPPLIGRPIYRTSTGMLSG